MGFWCKKYAIKQQWEHIYFHSFYYLKKYCIGRVLEKNRYLVLVDIGEVLLQFVWLPGYEAPVSVQCVIFKKCHQYNVYMVWKQPEAWPAFPVAGVRISEQVSRGLAAFILPGQRAMWCPAGPSACAEAAGRSGSDCGVCPAQPPHSDAEALAGRC